MKNIISGGLMVLLVSLWGASWAQCTINTSNTTTGFTPHNPAVIQPGVPYAQTVQVHIPATFSGTTIDSLHIDSISGMPSNITYVLNPMSGTVDGDSDGAMCFSGTTNAAPGAYPLIFYGNIYAGTVVIPISAAAGQFGYKFKVEAAPVAAFVADSPSCAGVDSVTLSDQTTGYPTSWSWTIPGGSPDTSHLQNPVVLFDSAGTFMVTLIAKNSISADTVTLPVVVNPPLSGNVITVPASGDSTANGSAQLILSSGTPPFVYLWSTNAVTDSIVNLIPGTYWVIANDAKGCQYVNDEINVTFLTGIQPLTAATLARIYPNPASDVLNLEWLQKSSAEITIYDLNGQAIRKWVTNADEHTACDIRGLASGAYLIRITDKTNNQQQALLFCVTNTAGQ